MCYKLYTLIPYTKKKKNSTKIVQQPYPIKAVDKNSHYEYFAQVSTYQTLRKARTNHLDNKQRKKFSFLFETREQAYILRQGSETKKKHLEPGTTSFYYKHTRLQSSKHCLFGKDIFFIVRFSFEKGRLF